MKRTLFVVLALFFMMTLWAQDLFDDTDTIGIDKIKELKANVTQRMGLKRTPKSLLQSMRTLKSSPRSLSAQELPKSVDLSLKLPAPGNQGAQGSCVAWSTAYAYKSFHENLERQWGYSDEGHLFSPAYIYNQINGGQDAGSAIPDALELMINKGCAPLSAMPYDVNDYRKQPSQKAHQEAAKYKARSYSSVNLNDDYAMKSILAGGNCIVVGLEVYENFDSYRGGIYKGPEGQIYGGHAILVVGYDDSKNAYKLLNSWSTSWGDKGYIWIDYKAFKQITFEAWVMMDVVSTTPSEKPAVPQYVEASQGSYSDQIVVTWEKVNSADSYILFRVTDPGKTPSEIGRVTKTQYIDTSITAGISYYYSVKSLGKGGQSDYSDYAQGLARDGSKEKLPGVPGGLSLAMAEGAVLISWNTTLGADTYLVYRWNGSKSDWEKIAALAKTEYTDKKVSPGNRYYYAVSAVNKYGEGKSTDALNIIVEKQSEQIPKVPEGLKITKGDYEDKILVSWKKSAGAGSYQVLRWYQGLGDWQQVNTTSELSFEDKAVSPGVYYYYMVAALNSAGESDPCEYDYGYVKEEEQKPEEDVLDWDDFFDSDDDWNSDWDESWDTKWDDFFDNSSYDSEAPEFTGRLYNANNGSCNIKGEDLDFYIDGHFVATVKSGDWVSVKLPGGSHLFKVARTKNKAVVEPGYLLEIDDELWYYWYGCDDGSHP
ncbi:MAG: hypothetical protein JXR70_15890 [Spirochaetales bacterium]|nr:hypothetical protein [Spirochaetales bacterium]